MKESPSFILKHGARIVFGIMVIFGIYMFSHGHLTQGGGFVADVNFDTLGGLANGLSTQFRVENTNVSNAYRTIQVLPSGSIKVIKP